MIKQKLKSTLKWLNDTSVTVFSRIHYRKETKEKNIKRGLKPIDPTYEKAIKQYWNQYGQRVDTCFHQWYTGCNGIQDVRYLPEDLFYDKVERYFNNVELEQAYVDKGIYGLFFKDIKQPDTITANINGVFYNNKYEVIERTEAIKLAKNESTFVIKPTRDSGGGKNVRLIEFDKENIEELFKLYDYDFILQKPLRQHHALAAVHKSSINTIRAISFFENGEVKILSAVLRMGADGSFVDNVGAGGLDVGINPDGTFSSVAYDGVGRAFTKHPQGFEFKNGYIPNYSKLIDVIKLQHSKMPHFGLISWDFTVDENEEPIMIEFNLRWEGLNCHQINHGPLFGKDTDRIMEMVFKKEQV